MSECSERSVALSGGEVAALCTAGAAAPSGANAQPWRVTVAGDRMTIGLDPARSGAAFVDVGSYASLFSLGCFAENVSIAADSLGLSHRRVVGTDTVDFLFTGRRGADPHELYDQLQRRVTNRRRSDGTRIAEDGIRRLRDAATATDPAFSLSAVCSPGGRRAVARALGRTDALRLRNGALFADMIGEICWTEREASSRRDGLDLPTLELPAPSRAGLRLLRRFPPVRRVLPRAALGGLAMALVDDCSHVCCLFTSAPVTGRTMLRAGAAMQRLWLTATRLGIAVQPWSVAAFLMMRSELFAGAGLTAAERREVDRIGGALRPAFGLSAADRPVFLFRLSHAAAPTARSLRRPWQSFTTLLPGAGLDSTLEGQS